MRVRDELPADFAQVRAVNAAAFPSPAEANLVDALRTQAHPCISLVAEVDGQVAGHIMFTPVSLNSHPALRIFGLAPLAVLPQHQRHGVGSALVRAGLQRCRDLSHGAVVVLGHPAYYPRFGFQPAARLGIGCEYDVPEDAFMLLELEPGYLQRASGTVAYHPAFAGL